MKTLTADEVRELLRRECRKVGGMRAWAREHGVSANYVSMVLSGERGLSASITIPLGLVKKEVHSVTWAVDNERECA